MKERTRTENMSAVRLFDTHELCTYIGMGRNSAVAFARKCGAEKRIGRRLLFDRAILDKALDEMTAD